jgi:hypothetical protein
MSSSSPAPGTPQTADKAKAAAAVTGLLMALAVGVARYFDDKNGTNFTEILSAVAAGVAGAGATGYATFSTRNKAKGLANRDGVV